MKRRLTFLALTLFMALGVAACGKSPASDNTPIPTPTPTVYATSTPEGVLDEIGEAGKDLMEGVGDAAKDITNGVKNAVR